MTDLTELVKTDLTELVKKAVAWFESLSPEEQEAHLKLQRESWVRGEMGLDRGPDRTTTRWDADLSRYAITLEELRARKTNLQLPYRSLRARLLDAETGRPIDRDY